MPSNYKYQKNGRKWEKVPVEAAIDYEDNVDLYNEDSWALLVSYWRACPDRLLDLLEADNPPYYLEPIQRVLIRIFFHYQHSFVTASRGFTKTFCCLTAKCLAGILYPGITFRYAAPSKEQMTEIATEKWKAITQQFPGLAAYWEVRHSTSNEFEIRTKHGSVITISAERGNDCNGVCAEEVAQEESGQRFDFKRFTEVVLPTARVSRNVQKERDPFFPQFQKQYITSAGTKQNAAYEYRCKTIEEMCRGDNSIALDFPWSVAVLSGIRDAEYYNDLRSKQSPEAQLREIESIWTGSSENPVVRDSALSEAKILPIMETRHCGDPNVFYVLGYDVSYAEGAKNAKCATAVIKGEYQTEEWKQDRFLKSLVYVIDESPKESAIQARRLKDRWYRFCMEGGKGTFIAIDAWQYGQSIVEALHKDLGDGLPPLCCINHDLPELEAEDAIPAIYPIRATAGLGYGSRDNDAEMIRYVEMEFEHRNVKILVNNLYEGIRAYKIKHHIKEDSLDPVIAVPYLKTREFCGQISNLQKKRLSLGFAETRISKSIQRDMWSAFKYGMRLMSIIERQELIAGVPRQSAWSEYFKNPHKAVEPERIAVKPKLTVKTNPRIKDGWRRGGNLNY